MNFYFQAAKTLDRLDGKQGSIKGIIATLPEKDRKRTAALVIETLKFKSVLIEVIEKANLSKEERKLSSLNLALVLVHDLLLAKGIQAGDGPIKQAVLRHKTRLHGEFQKVKIKRGASSNIDLADNGDERAALIPRYVRVNSLLCTTESAIEDFVSRGFILSDPFSSKRGFSRDFHVPDLLLFSPQTTFKNDPLYLSGKIILQDKASCFPAIVLLPPATDKSVVIDATAAPGNKTSHLSALMGNKGRLYAFERDRKRFSTLKMMLSKARCANVTPINADFLTMNPSDPQFNSVTHMCGAFFFNSSRADKDKDHPRLLDPSCSGSGIVNRLDHLLETEPENDATREERLAKLATFQLMMIKHAMRFPNVKKIVYSTCSIHATENEHVVRDALNSDEAKGGTFLLAPQNEVLPEWARRGHPDELDSPDQASSLIRCLPGEDATNGFFVSCFVKRPGVTRKRKDFSGTEAPEASASGSLPRKKKIL